MPRRSTLLVALLLVAPTLTGCLGLAGQDGGDDGLETQRQAEVSAETGGIEGIVTDEAIQPIADATVTIEQTGNRTTTAEDGSFAFSNLPPASYDVNISADGFIPTEKTVDVQADSVATIDVVLAHEPTVTPYSQQFEFQGFLECSAAIPDTTAAVIGIGAVAVCAIPNFLLGGNATNDRFLFTHAIEANPWQMVTELSWEPGNPTAQEMSLVVEAEGFSNNNSATFSERSGPGPIILDADRERIAGLVDNLTAACEKGDDDACNLNYIEDGGPIQIRTFVDATDLEPGLAVQQDYTLFNTIFYNAPACEDFSIIEDNQCTQQDTPPEEDPYDG